MSRTPGRDIHKDTVYELSMLFKGGIHQTVLGLCQRDSVGVVGLEMFIALSKVLRQFTDFYLVTQQIVEEEIRCSLVFLIAKHDIALTAFLNSGLEELLLMTQKDILLICSCFQGTDAGTHVVADVLRKTVDAQ